MRFPLKRVLLISAIVIAALMISGMFWLRSGWDERLSNKAVVIDRESESPDRTMVLVIYRFDIGALGYTAERDVVVPANRLHGDLKGYILPKQYDPIGWEKDKNTQSRSISSSACGKMRIAHELTIHSQEHESTLGGMTKLRAINRRSKPTYHHQTTACGL